MCSTFTWKTVKCKPTPSNYQRFVRAIKTGVNDVNDFVNGAKIQAYLDSQLRLRPQHADR